MSQVHGGNHEDIPMTSSLVASMNTSICGKRKGRPKAAE
jgi:hypothetical protein